MNIFRIKSVSLLLVCVFLLSSCASVLPDPSQIRTEEERIDARNKCIAMYTAGGAAAGALLGGLIGSDWKAAGIGAPMGGGLAFLAAWGHCLNLYSTLQSTPVAGYQQTAQQVGYNPTQGNMTKIQGFNVTPGTINPGQTVNLGGSYYVMAPQGAKEMKVTETRYVKFFDPSKNEWTNLGGIDQEITAAPGLRKADGKFDIPKDVPEGKYRIGFKVASA